MLKNKKGFTLIELIVVIVILAILMAVTLPSLLGYIEEAQEKTCAANRALFVRHYNIFSINPTKSGTLADFLVAAERNGMVKEKICPAEEQCAFAIADGKLVVTCPKHGSNEAAGTAPAPAPTRTIGTFSNTTDALKNAEILYDEATKYWASLFAAHPSFNGVAWISATKQGSTANVNFWEDGVKTIIYVENELSAIINPDKASMGDVKVYFAYNPITKKYDSVDYVAIKSGSTWAKYSPTAQQTGTASDPWDPKIPPTSP